LGQEDRDWYREAWKQKHRAEDVQGDPETAFVRPAPTGPRLTAFHLLLWLGAMIALAALLWIVG